MLGRVCLWPSPPPARPPPPAPPPPPRCPSAAVLPGTCSLLLEEQGDCGEAAAVAPEEEGAEWSTGEELSRGSQETLPREWARDLPLCPAPPGCLTEFFAWSCTKCGPPSFPWALREGPAAWWEPAVGYGGAGFCKCQVHSLGVWAQIHALKAGAWEVGAHEWAGKNGVRGAALPPPPSGKP